MTYRRIFFPYLLILAVLSGQYFPALALVTLCLVGTNNTNVVIFLLVFAVSSNAGVNCGIGLNHIDLSPVHAGTLMGIANSASAAVAMLAPLSVNAFSSMTGYTEVRSINVLENV